MTKSMLFRLFAILTAVAGLGMIGVTQLLVRPHIQRLVDERELNKQNWQQEGSRARKLANDVKKYETKLASAQQTVEKIERQLAAARAMADQQKGRADMLEQNIAINRHELNETQQRLTPWKTFEIPVETVRQVIESEKRLRQESAILREELRVLLAENRRLGVISVPFLR